MLIKSIRPIKEMSEVVMNPSVNEEGTAYWVFSEISNSESKWENLTILSPYLYGTEFNKTYGHYHPENAPDETYKLISGKGIFLLQEKHYEQGKLDPQTVNRVLLVSLVPGEEITIPNKWGHAWINISDNPLITFDNWRSGHTPQDYSYIKQVKGMAYYILKQGESFQVIPNPNYINLPNPEQITVKEFANL